MLTGPVFPGPNTVEGDDGDVVRLPEIEAKHLAVAVRYMEFKLAKRSGGAQKFEIDGDMAVALFRVANYLDLWAGRAQQGQQERQAQQNAGDAADPSNDSDNVEDVDYEEVKE